MFLLQSYCPFSIFLEDFSVTFKNNNEKTNGHRNEILFVPKLTGQRQKFKGKSFDRKCPDFFVCLFFFQIVLAVKYRS